MEGSAGRRERHPRPRGRVRRQVGPAGPDRWAPQGAPRPADDPAGAAAHVVRPADGASTSATSCGRPRARPRSIPDRFAVVIGTGLGGGEKIVEMYDAMNEGGPRKVSPLAVQMVMPNGAAAVVGLELGARAGVITPVSACSSGSEAIAHAWRQIVMGDADIAVCGGVEGGIEALPIAAFSMMRAMSTRNDDPEGGVAPVRQGPRRIRVRRGRRADDHRDRGARQGPRRQAAGPADGCRHHVGRLPHGGSGTGRPAGRRTR